MPRSSDASPLNLGAKPDRGDLRYLGRLLGDVIRETDGIAVFERIEAIRQASVAVHRTPGVHAEATLAQALDQLDLGDSLRFIRGDRKSTRLNSSH